jgi:hypothetical protein
VTDFPRIDPEGLSDRELILATLKGMEATHACIDGFRAEQVKVNRHASEVRHAQGQELMNLRGDIIGVQQSVAEVREDLTGVRGEIGEVKAAQEIADGAVSGLAKALGVIKSAPGEKAPKVRGIAGWSGWTVFGAMSGLVLAYKIIVPLLEPAFHVIHHAIMAVQ